EALYPRSLAQLSDKLSRLTEGRLWLQVLIGMALGMALGIAIGPTGGWLDERTGVAVGNWLALPGRLFLVGIQMIVVPLVFASIVRGLAASENAEQLRKLGVRVVLFFVATTAAAAAIGIGLALTIEPGSYINPDLLVGISTAEAPSTPVGLPALAELPERLVGLLPRNPLVSIVQGEMLQIVIVAFIGGIALVSMTPASARPLLDLLGSVQEVCMTVVRWAMLVAPLAVFGLMAQVASRTGAATLLGVGVYILTVILGLALLLLLLIVVAYVFARLSPKRFFKGSREVLLLAFSTSSSAAVMPLTIQVAQSSLGVRRSIAQFVIPLGATINMNGTALYQGVAAMFLAQAFGVDVSLSGMILVVIMSVAASIGSPATPGVGIVILSVILVGIGVPPAGVALIMGVDRLLDMTRTMVNVAGDLVASVVMDHWVGGEQTAEQEMADERAREKLRAKTGADTIIE
ncbi:MAG: dicarboxylate/amino acid:cation symporter, partial [Gammaproteobacteria bacterium]